MLFNCVIDSTILIFHDILRFLTMLKKIANLLRKTNKNSIDLVAFRLQYQIFIDDVRKIIVLRLSMIVKNN